MYIELYHSDLSLTHFYTLVLLLAIHSTTFIDKFVIIAQSMIVKLKHTETGDYKPY